MSVVGLGRVKTLLHDADRRGRTRATVLRSIWADFTATRPELILTRGRGSFSPHEPQRRARAPLSHPHRRQQRFHPNNVQHACQIVAERAQRHLGRNFSQRHTQEVRCAHAQLQCAERMLDGLAACAHGVWILVESRLRAFENVLVYPSLDTALPARRALRFEWAGFAGVRPIVAQLLAVFLVGIIVSEFLTGWAAKTSSSGK